MTDFLYAAAGFALVVSLILYLEYRSRPRDPKQAGLRAANRGPAGLRDQLEREKEARRDRG